MTLFDSTAYEVTKETLRYAKSIAKDSKNEFSRKRIYEALICLRTLAEYFEDEGFRVDNQSTLHQILPINEELECNDLRCNGRCIDVRTVVNGKYILIPKSYYKYNVLPDLFAVAKYNSDSKTVNILGCIEPLEIDKQRQNEKYFIMDTSQLIQPFQIEDRIKLVKNTKISNQNHELYASYYIDYCDGVLPEENKKELFKHLFECKGCRDRFANLYNLEIIVKHSSEYPEILQDKLLNIVGATDVDNEKYKDYPEITLEVEKEPDKYEEEDFLNEIKGENKNTEDPLQVLYGKKSVNSDVFNSFKQKPIIEKRPKSILDSVMADIPKLPINDVTVDMSVSVQPIEIKQEGKTLGKINPSLYEEDYSDGIDLSKETKIENKKEPKYETEIEEEKVPQFEYIEDIVTPESDSTIYNQEDDEPMFINELKPQADETSALDEMLLLDKPVSQDIPQFANYKSNVSKIHNTEEEDIIIIDDDEDNNLNIHTDKPDTEPVLESNTIPEEQNKIEIIEIEENNKDKSIISKEEDKIESAIEKYEDVNEKDLVHFNVEDIDITEEYENKYVVEENLENTENVNIVVSHDENLPKQQTVNNILSTVEEKNEDEIEILADNENEEEQIKIKSDDEDEIEILDDNENEEEQAQIKSNDEDEIEILDDNENEEEQAQIKSDDEDEIEILDDNENEEEQIQIKSDDEDEIEILDDNRNEKEQIQIKPDEISKKYNEVNTIDIPGLDFGFKDKKPVNINLPEISTDIGDHNPLYETIDSNDSVSSSESDNSDLTISLDDLNDSDLLNNDLPDIGDIDLSLNFDENLELDNNQTSLTTENHPTSNLEQEKTNNEFIISSPQTESSHDIDMPAYNNFEENSEQEEIIEEPEEKDDDDIILIDDTNRPIISPFKSTGSIPFETKSNQESDDDIILIDDEEETNTSTFFRPASVSDLNNRFMETEDTEIDEQAEIDEIDDDITFVNQEDDEITNENQFVRPAGAVFDSQPIKLETEENNIQESIITNDDETDDQFVIENDKQDENINHQTSFVSQPQKTVKYDEDGFEIEDDETDEDTVILSSEQNNEQLSDVVADETFEDDKTFEDDETNEAEEYSDDGTEEYDEESDEIDDDGEEEEESEEEETTDNKNNLIKKVAIIGIISLIGLGGIGGGLFYYLNKAKQEKMQNIAALNALNEDSGAVENTELNQEENLNLDEGEEGIQLPEEGENKELAEQMPPQEKAVAEKNGEEQLPPPPAPATETKKPQPETAKSKDMNQAMTNAFSDNPSSLKVTKTSWAVAPYIAADTEFKAFLQTSGRAIQASIKKNLLTVKDNTYSENTKVQIVFSDGKIADVSISKSSGSKQIDEIVLQSVKDYMNNAQLPKLSETSVQAIKNANGNNSFKLTLSVNF